MKNNPTRLVFFFAFGIIFSLFIGLVLLSFSQELDRLLEPAPTDLPYSAFPEPLVRALEAFHHPGFARALRGARMGRPDFRGTLATQLVKGGSEMSQAMKRIGYTALLEYGHARQTLVTFYFNRTFVGNANDNPILGFAEATRIYFGISPERLNLGEALLLCDLALNPQTASDLNDPDAALRVRNRLLSVMRQSGLLADSEYDAEVSRPYSTPPDHRPLE